jgi:glycosyltransferase involved in cell wall biosynthesis
MTGLMSINAPIDTPEIESISISVVIPTYNYAKLLPRAIQSVTTQLDNRTELIIIDDGSTDETNDILEKLSDLQKHNIRCIRQLNAGPAAARNRGLSMAHGEYLIFLDADDKLLPGTLSKLIDTIEVNPDTDMILGGYITVDAKGRKKAFEPTPVQGQPENRIRDYLLEKKIRVLHGCSLFRKTLLGQHPYPESLRQNEDLPVFAYMVAHARTLLIRQPLAEIFKHSDSLRHDASQTLKASPERIAELVFEGLPPECRSLRKAYETQRLLSAFRTIYRAGDYKTAKQYYHAAFVRNWLRALRWSYLSKYLRLLTLRTRP